MRTMQRIALLAAGAFAAGVFGAAAPAFAHHSTAAFDNGQVIKIEGKITQFRWINPHASIKIEGKADHGPDGLWTIEMTAPNVLINEGWTRNDGSQGALYVGVVLADGSTLGRVDGKPLEPRN
jgi:hypothetical protein